MSFNQCTNSSSAEGWRYSAISQCHVIRNELNSRNACNDDGIEVIDVVEGSSAAKEWGITEGSGYKLCLIIRRRFFGIAFGKIEFLDRF